MTSKGRVYAGGTSGASRKILGRVKSDIHRKKKNSGVAEATLAAWRSNFRWSMDAGEIESTHSAILNETSNAGHSSPLFRPSVISASRSGRRPDQWQ